MKKVFLMCILAVTADAYMPPRPKPSAPPPPPKVTCCKGPNMTFNSRDVSEVGKCGVFQGTSCDNQKSDGQPYPYPATNSSGRH
jgi:hypothetical protein